MQEPHKTSPHSLGEDILAFVIGTSMVALSVQLLQHLGLITGQTAGLAVLLSYVGEQSFGLWFFVINLPFYVLAWWRMGLRFTVKTFIAVALVSVLTEVLPTHLSFAALTPAVGAFFAGAAAGLGLLAIFRHGGSLGGIGILGLYIQEQTGFRAGWVQLGFDFGLFALAFWLLADPWLVAYSALGAFVINLVVGLNHRKDRYTGR